MYIFVKQKRNPPWLVPAVLAAQIDIKMNRFIKTISLRLRRQRQRGTFKEAENTV